LLYDGIEIHLSQWWDCSSKHTKCCENLFIRKFWKLNKNKFNTLFFQRDAMIAYKTRSSINFSSLIQIEQVDQASQGEKNKIYK